MRVQKKLATRTAALTHLPYTPDEIATLNTLVRAGMGCRLAHYLELKSMERELRYEIRS